MTSLPQPLVRVRSPRVRLPEITPVVLRFSNGHRAPVELSVVSLTGGLLRVPKPVAHGARVSMMFLTQTGPVIGQAELLNPTSWTEQPFRFVALQADDQRRLRAAIQASAPAPAAISTPVPASIVAPAPARAAISTPVSTSVSASAPAPLSTSAPVSKFTPVPSFLPVSTSAAVAGADNETEWIAKYRAAMDAPPPRSKMRAVLAALALATIGLVGFVYFFTPHLLK